METLNVENMENTKIGKKFSIFDVVDFLDICSEVFSLRHEQVPSLVFVRFVTPLEMMKETKTVYCRGLFVKKTRVYKGKRILVPGFFILEDRGSRPLSQFAALVHEFSHSVAEVNGYPSYVQYDDSIPWVDRTEERRACRETRLSFDAIWYRFLVKIGQRKPRKGKYDNAIRNYLKESEGAIKGVKMVALEKIF